MVESTYPGCDFMYHELWIAGTVCALGWTCFLIALTFLSISLYNEYERLKKTQNEIIIFRTSTRNAMLEAAMLARTPASPPPVTTVFVQSPQPTTSNFHLQSPPGRHVIKPKQAPELPNSRVYPNSFSYTPAGMPLETQISHQAQVSVTSNIPSPPPVPPRWTNTTQTYPTNR